MFKPVQFPEPVESMVRFVEETDPSEIIEATLEKLRGGTPVIDLLRAAGLAVVRSTDLPPNHHGGPVHPVSRHFRDLQHLPSPRGRERLHPGCPARNPLQ